MHRVSAFRAAACTLCALLRHFSRRVNGRKRLLMRERWQTCRRKAAHRATYLLCRRSGKEGEGRRRCCGARAVRPSETARCAHASTFLHLLRYAREIAQRETLSAPISFPAYQRLSTLAAKIAEQRRRRRIMNDAADVDSAYLRTGWRAPVRLCGAGRLRILFALVTRVAACLRQATGAGAVQINRWMVSPTRRALARRRRPCALRLAHAPPAPPRAPAGLLPWLRRSFGAKAHASALSAHAGALGRRHLIRGCRRRRMPHICTRTASSTC